MDAPLWRGCAALSTQPTAAGLATFCKAYPPHTLFSYLDASSASAEHATETSTLARTLRTVLCSQHHVAAASSEAIAPMLRVGMAHASATVRALCADVMYSRIGEEGARGDAMLRALLDDAALLDAITSAVCEDDDTTVAEGSAQVLLRLAAATPSSASLSGARARVAARLVARATVEGDASSASARCLDVAARMTCASDECFAELAPVGALRALSSAVRRGDDLLSQLSALEIVESVVALRPCSAMHVVEDVASDSLLSTLLRICEAREESGGGDDVASYAFRAAAAVVSTVVRARGDGAVLAPSAARLLRAAHAQLAEPASRDAPATLAAAEALGRLAGASRSALGAIVRAEDGALLRCWLGPLGDRVAAQSLPLRMHTCAQALEGGSSAAAASLDAGDADGDAPAEALFAAVSAGSGSGSASGGASSKHSTSCKSSAHATVKLLMGWIEGERGGVAASYRDAACHALRSAAAFDWGVRAMLSTPGFEEWLLTPTASAPLRSDAEWKYGVVQAIASSCDANPSFAAAVIGDARLARVRRRVAAGPFRELDSKGPHALTAGQR